jgi:hypothetical protein
VPLSLDDSVPTRVSCAFESHEPFGSLPGSREEIDGLVSGVRKMLGNRSTYLRKVL